MSEYRDKVAQEYDDFVYQQHAEQGDIEWLQNHIFNYDDYKAEKSGK